MEANPPTRLLASHFDGSRSTFLLLHLYNATRYHYNYVNVGMDMNVHSDMDVRSYTNIYILIDGHIAFIRALISIRYLYL